jgi:hypothetical protein
MAHRGHPSPSAGCPLSGIERKSDLGAVRPGFDPERTSGASLSAQTMPELFPGNQYEALCFRDGPAGRFARANGLEKLPHCGIWETGVDRKIAYCFI